MHTACVNVCVFIRAYLYFVYYLHKLTLINKRICSGLVAFACFNSQCAIRPAQLEMQNEAMILKQKILNSFGIALRMRG